LVTGALGWLLGFFAIFAYCPIKIVKTINP